MKEAFAGVRAEAAMMRSPSFSRWGLSRTRTNSPAAGRGESVVSEVYRRGGCGRCTEGLDGGGNVVEDEVAGVVCHCCGCV